MLDTQRSTQYSSATIQASFNKIGKSDETPYIAPLQSLKENDPVRIYDEDYARISSISSTNRISSDIGAANEHHNSDRLLPNRSISNSSSMSASNNTQSFQLFRNNERKVSAGSNAEAYKGPSFAEHKGHSFIENKGPTFVENSMSRTVQITEGETAHLVCRVRNLGHHAVSNHVALIHL